MWFVIFQLGAIAINVASLVLGLIWWRRTKRRVTQIVRERAALLAYLDDHGLCDVTFTHYPDRVVIDGRRPDAGPVH